MTAIATSFQIASDLIGGRADDLVVATTAYSCAAEM